MCSCHHTAVMMHARSTLRDAVPMRSVQGQDVKSSRTLWKFDRAPQKTTNACRDEPTKDSIDLDDNVIRANLLHSCGDARAAHETTETCVCAWLGVTLASFTILRSLVSASWLLAITEALDPDVASLAPAAA